ncbi:tryptophan-rich sensory protein [Candidatus Saccharibacteria bacterium]|nr:tryptophan-rich sensory protein [Candidatus Saccharibacteria bacterium]
MPKKPLAKKSSAKKSPTKKSPAKKKSAKKSTPRIKNSVKGKKEKFTFGKFLIAVCLIALPLVVGLISAALTGDAMMNFNTLRQPPLAPPAWIFPFAWTILYLLMGVASYLIYRFKPKTPAEKDLRKTELIIYSIQLIFNFCWTIFFFRLGLRFFAFGWLVAMWLMIYALIFMTFKNRKSAAWCLIPYILWCTFAAYLNIMIAMLN